MDAYTLRIYWSKREKDWMIDGPNGPDKHLTHAWMSGRLTFDQFIEELQTRGYDVSTLRLSVKRPATTEGK